MDAERSERRDGGDPPNLEAEQNSFPFLRRLPRTLTRIAHPRSTLHYGIPLSPQFEQFCNAEGFPFLDR